MLRKTLVIPTAIVCALGIAACERSAPRQAAFIPGQNDTEPGALGSEKFSQVDAATADIAPTGDQQVSGTVRFTPDKGESRMKIEISLAGLNPGLHGFHIHTHPDCGDDGKAAGPHFNPQKKEHGSPEGNQQHAGDLGNIQANADGKVDTVILTEQLSFSGPASALHHSVVIHANADDMRSQPSGNAGKRIACGVVRPAQDVLASSHEV